MSIYDDSKMKSKAQTLQLNLCLINNEALAYKQAEILQLHEYYKIKLLLYIALDFGRLIFD